MLKAILFDFDGVIVNSYEHTIYCFQNIFEKFGKPIPSDDDFKSLLGFTIINILKRLLPDESEKNLNTMFDEFKRVSDETFAKVPLMPDAEKVIRELGEKYQLAVVSNRRTKSLHKLLLHHELNNYFSVILGKEDVTHPKPHPEGIEKALKTIGIKANEAVFIGDAEQDVLAAKNANMSCVLINENDNVHNAKYHCNEISKLPQLILEIAKHYEK